MSLSPTMTASIDDLVDSRTSEDRTLTSKLNALDVKDRQPTPTLKRSNAFRIKGRQDGWLPNEILEREEPQSPTSRRTLLPLNRTQHGSNSAMKTLSQVATARSYGNRAESVLRRWTHLLSLREKFLKDDCLTCISTWNNVELLFWSDPLDAAKQLGLVGTLLDHAFLCDTLTTCAIFERDSINQ